MNMFTKAAAPDRLREMYFFLLNENNHGSLVHLIKAKLLQELSEHRVRRRSEFSGGVPVQQTMDWYAHMRGNKLSWYM